MKQEKCFFFASQRIKRSLRFWTSQKKQKRQFSGFAEKEIAPRFSAAPKSGLSFLAVLILFLSRKSLQRILTPARYVGELPVITAAKRISQPLRGWTGGPFVLLYLWCKKKDLARLRGDFSPPEKERESFGGFSWHRNCRNCVCTRADEAVTLSFVFFFRVLFILRKEREQNGVCV